MPVTVALEDGNVGIERTCNVYASIMATKIDDRGLSPSSIPVLSTVNVVSCKAKNNLDECCIISERFFPVSIILHQPIYSSHSLDWGTASIVISKKSLHVSTSAYSHFRMTSPSGLAGKLMSKGRVPLLM